MRYLTSTAAVVLAVLILSVAQPAHAQEDTNSNDTDKPTYVEEVEVERGDTLTKIADEFETTYVRLYDANEEIDHPDVIFPGDEVQIPHEDAEFDERQLPEDAAVPVPEPKPAANPTPTPDPNPPAPATSDPEPQAPATSSGVWDRLAACESGGNWSINTGNGYYGGLQFSLSSWRAVDGQGYPHQASKAKQINRAEKLQAIQGWGAWPACTLKLGIR